MELQELDPAAEPSRSLSDSLKDIFRGHRLADRSKDAPLRRRVDRIPHVSWQPVPEIPIDQLGVAVMIRHVLRWFC